jgi:hypothetical protein
VIDDLPETFGRQRAARDATAAKHRRRASRSSSLPTSSLGDTFIILNMNKVCEYSCWIYFSLWHIYYLHPLR